MKIFAGGIATETNTFSPIPTGLEDYLVHRAKDAQDTGEMSSFDLTEIWGEQARASGHEFVYSLMAWAQPAGVTVRSAYEALRDELLSSLREAMPVDIVLLMLHGAMIAEGYADCEEDIMRRIREMVGKDTVIGVELDLHCHLYARKLSLADLIVTYKEYPHIDINERARDLLDMALQTRRGEIQPKMGLFDCKMIGQYPTSRNPLRRFVDSLKAAEGYDRVLSISFAHGFPFADVAHVGAKLLVVTDNDQRLADEMAQHFGLLAYRMRRDIGFEGISLPLHEGLSKALACEATPVVVADQSDNCGGGAPGDATFVLRWLLNHRAQDVALAIFYDPEIVRIARKAGVGARLPIRLGGKLGPCSGDPLDLEVSVVALRSQYMHEFPQSSGKPALFPLGDVAAFRCGTLEFIVSSQRCQCYAPSIFGDLGIDPSRKRLLVVKSTQHFYAAFAPIAKEVIYIAAPGAVSPDPRGICYRRVDTSQIYPWVEDPLGLES